MNDSLLVRVLNGLADLDEQFKAFTGAEAVLVAVVSDFYTTNQFHHKIRPTGICRADVQDPRDVRVVHQRQGLPLGLEPRHDLARVHAELDHLDRNATADRLLLLSHEDHAAATLADLL